MSDSDRLQKNLAALADLSDAEKVAAFDKAAYAVASFSGSLEELEKAIGMLMIGYHFGWKVLLLVHSKRTIKKYETILDLDIKEFFPAEGRSAQRSIGLDIAKQIGNFWQVVSGDIKIENRRDVEDVNLSADDQPDNKK
jgi:predicted Rossmann-fold nucleotide-binding protein